jgi:hypothetical protein
MRAEEQETTDEVQPSEGGLRIGLILKWLLLLAVLYIIGLFFVADGWSSRDWIWAITCSIGVLILVFARWQTGLWRRY